LGQDFIMSPGFIARVGSTVVHDVRPPNKQRFRSICAQLGLEWIDTDEV
jgi:mannose-6-phosphate isomerase-like protein (cupin superfamily)